MFELIVSISPSKLIETELPASQQYFVVAIKYRLITVPAHNSFIPSFELNSNFATYDIDPFTWLPGL